MIAGVWGGLVGASETGERSDLFYSDLSIELTCAGSWSWFLNC